MTEVQYECDNLEWLLESVSEGYWRNIRMEKAKGVLFNCQKEIGETSIYYYGKTEYDT